MRFENSLLSVGNCPSIYFLIQIVSVMRRASSSQPANPATDLNPGLKFPFFFFYRLAETEKKKVETKKGEQKIVTGKQQGAKICAASCSASTFDFHCGIKLVSFRPVSAFADQF